MVTRQEIEMKIKECKAVLHEKYSVKNIGLFGSYARGQENENSDVDILVEFSRPIGWEFVDLKEDLENILGKKVDLVTVGALKPEMKDKVLNEVFYL